MKYPRNFFMAHLNINSIRHKFYEIYNMLNGNRIDIFGISETKINASFTNAQFNIPGFKLHRQDRDLKGNGGGILVYIKDSIPHRILRKHSGITDGVEYMSFEVCFKSVNGSLRMYISRPRSVMIVHGAFCLTWLIVLSTTEMSLYFSAILTMICLKTMFFVTCATFMISRTWCVVLLASKVKPRHCWMFFWPTNPIVFVIIWIFIPEYRLI